MRSHLVLACAQPGCYNLQPCPKHFVKRRPEKSATERGYGPQWRRTRAAVLLAEPSCRWPGCSNASTDCDHIVAKGFGGTDDRSNLRGLCDAHHKVKTRMDAHRRHLQRHDELGPVTVASVLNEERAWPTSPSASPARR